jgi:chromosome segregation ATPase
MAQLEAAAAANVELAQRAEDAERRARENEASLADAAAEAKRAAHEISSLKLELEQTRARLCVLDEAVKSQSHATAPSAQEFAPELDAAKTRAAELAAALARVEAELAATRAAQQALATRASAAEAAVREAQSKLSESEQAVSVERDLVRILRQEVQNLSSESALRSSLEQQLALKAEELERYALESEQRDRTAATHISRAQRDAENASRLLENERDLVRVLKQEVQRLSLESERRSVLENQLAELAAAGERRVAEMTARSQADAETISGLRRELEVLQGKLSVQDAAAAIGQRGDKSLPVSGCGEVDDADQDLTASVAARQQAPPGRSGERRDRSLNASLIRAARALHAALAQNGALRTELQAVERRAQRAESSALELSREKESLQQLIREHESRSSKVQQESGSNLALFEQRATFAESEARKAEAARLSLAEELRVARAELTALRDCVDSAVCQAETKECEAEDALAASACHLQRAKAVEALLGLREEAMRLAEREHHALRQELAATKEMASATQEQLAKAMKQIAIDMQEREELGRKLEAEKAERAALQARLAEVEARARETEGHLREAMRSGIDAMRQQLQAALSESHALRNQPQDSAGVARVAELGQQLHLARQSLHAERDSAEALRHQSANIAKLQSALNEKERELASANRERSGLAAELQSAQEQRARAETALVDSQRHAHLFETRMEAMSRKFQEDLRTREEKIAFMTERAAQLEAQLGLVRQREDNLMRHLQQQQLKAAGDSAELLQLVGALRAEVVALQAARDRAAREIARTPSGRARRVHDRLQQASESPIPARRARKTDYEGEPRAADRKGATATRGDPLLESIRAKEMRLKELTAARAGYRAGVGTPLPVTPEAAHRALAGAPHGATSDNSLTGQSPPNKPGDHQPC